MHSIKATRLYIASIIIVAITILFFSLFMISFDRESFIGFLLRHLQRPYLSGILHDSIITSKKFLLIRYLCFALISIDGLVIFLLYRYRERVMNFLFFFFNSVRHACLAVIAPFKTSSKKENFIFLLLLSVVIAKELYYIITTDLQYDEMWCYNYYTSRPFYLNFFSFSTYPLFELLTHAFKWLPFSAKINLRLPVLFAGIFSCIIIYAGVKKLSNNFLVAMACFALFASLPGNSFYMLYAKGVMLELFFAIISFFCIVFFLKKDFARRYLLVFVIVNVAGFYAMLTHVYFWALQLIVGSMYISFYRRYLLKPFLISNGFILFFSFFFYMPVLIGSGFSFILNVAFGQTNNKDPWTGIVPFMKYINLFFTGNSYGFVIALLSAGSVLMIFRKTRKENIFLFACGVALFILPLIVRIIQRIYIAERAIPFIGLIVPLCGFLIYSIIKDHVKKYLVSLSIVFLFTLMCVVTHFHYFRSWNVRSDKNAITISELLMQHHVNNCYDNAPDSRFFYYYPALEYYYHQKGLSIDLRMAAQNSLRYKSFSPADDYDCIIENISESDSNHLGEYEDIYHDTDEGFKILLRKGK